MAIETTEFMGSSWAIRSWIFSCFIAIRFSFLGRCGMGAGPRISQLLCFYVQMPNYVPFAVLRYLAPICGNSPGHMHLWWTHRIFREKLNWLSGGWRVLWRHDVRANALYF